MAEHENKKSLKDRAQEMLQGVMEAVESLLPSQQPKLIPVRVVARPPMPRRRR